jgi:hypothetical protein
MQIDQHRTDLRQLDAEARPVGAVECLLQVFPADVTPGQRDAQDVALEQKRCQEPFRVEKVPDTFSSERLSTTLKATRLRRWCGAGW